MKIHSYFALIATVSLIVASCGGNSSKTGTGEIVSVESKYDVGGAVLEMVTVPSNAFTMGSRRDGFRILGTSGQHEVVMSGFAISKEPVSKALWAAVMGGEGGDGPVTGVSLKDAEKFASKLSKKTGTEFRVPSEAMYEDAIITGAINECDGLTEWTTDVFSDGTVPGVAVDYENLGQGTNHVVRSYAERKGVADYTKSGEITFRVAAGPVSGVDPVLKAAFIDGNPERESVSADETVKVGDVSFKMVGVEGGSFRMGATEEQVENADADEKPVKDVTLEGFEIGETEVTAALWNAVMRSLPYGNDAAEGDKPVVNVSYYDAEEFILKLNELTGRKFRLPTEAEWEYAARGGSKSSGYKFAGASECYKVGQFVQNASSKVQPVKGLKPNELGIYDMSGNVWEWTCGLYDNYADGTVSDPDSRVLRGGSCSSKWDACRVSNRQEMKAVNVKGTFGFRLAL